jgi:hypothetical protein
MHFQARYLIKNYDFQGAQISVSDPKRQIDVQIAKRPDDETHPPIEPHQAIAIATCQRDILACVEDEAASSGSYSQYKEEVIQANEDMQALVLRTLRLARWRANCPKSGLSPIQYAFGFKWSLDGKEWRRYADESVLTSIKLVFSTPSWPWTDEKAEFVRTEILGELDEPLAHGVLREAALNCKDNPRSSLVLAVAAAEIGFKQFASASFPEAAWILEKLQSPSLETMLKVFPWSKLPARINGKAATIPNSTKSGLKKAVELRNQVVHVGVLKLDTEKVDSALTSVRDLLYFLDALRGQGWAFEHMSQDALKSLS